MLQILPQNPVHKIAGNAEFTRRSGDIFVRTGLLNLAVSDVRHSRRPADKKNRAPRRGPVGQYTVVGDGNIFQRGTCCCTGDSGRTSVRRISEPAICGD